MTAPAAAWPEGLLLSYYGDDFTGSTDVMEAFTAAGVPTMLFLRPPTPKDLARFPGLRCVGLAGTSRGRSPEWMAAELPAAFESLASLGAPLLQYKICSTFDSSPSTGSIGCAIALGAPLMAGTWSPLVVGAPRLNRFQLFGNLFAAVNGVGHRLDRHPTMSRHPVTPMAEADLRRHLAEQTTRRIELIDMLQLRAGTAADRLQQMAGDDVPVVLIDVLDDETLAEAGRLIWEQRGKGLFSASSSGLQYALAAHWRHLGLVPMLAGLPRARPVEQIAVVSGSCSPVTATQIAIAAKQGFATERLDLPGLLAEPEAEIERAVGLALAALAKGQSPLIYSAAGPDDPAVAGFEAIAAEARLSREQAALRVGQGLAQVMRRLLDRSALKRIVVAGGDSSGEVASALDIAALSVVAGLAPGAPLCRVWSDRRERDGLEVVLKGGQMGGPSFFADARAGAVVSSPPP
ncbi:MAG: four-carbon acid sugar kinase family protein [Burkholderiaceae bacterium]|nr:four-carbon acid sugar kinase family protein [Burkholderiaceae bacterium]